MELLFPIRFSRQLVHRCEPPCFAQYLRSMGGVHAQISPLRSLYVALSPRATRSCAHCKQWFRRFPCAVQSSDPTRHLVQRSLRWREPHEHGPSGILAARCLVRCALFLDTNIVFLGKVVPLMDGGPEMTKNPMRQHGGVLRTAEQGVQDLREI